MSSGSIKIAAKCQERLTIFPDLGRIFSDEKLYFIPFKCYYIFF